MVRLGECRLRKTMQYRVVEIEPSVNLIQLHTVRLESVAKQRD